MDEKRVIAIHVPAFSLVIRYRRQTARKTAVIHSYSYSFISLYDTPQQIVIQATLLKIKERNRKSERKHQYNNKAKPMLGNYMAYQYMSLNDSRVIKFLISYRVLFT